MRKHPFVLAALMLATLSFAGNTFAIEKGNDRKGKYTYRKVYTACHARGEVDSPKPPISPDAKTMAQWEEVFTTKAFDEFGCKTEWEALSEADLSDIFSYLYKHAADSPTPAKCN